MDQVWGSCVSPESWATAAALFVFQKGKSNLQPPPRLGLPSARCRLREMKGLGHRRHSGFVHDRLKPRHVPGAPQQSAFLPPPGPSPAHAAPRVDRKRAECRGELSARLRLRDSTASPADRRVEEPPVPASGRGGSRGGGEGTFWGGGRGHCRRGPPDVAARLCHS